MTYYVLVLFLLLSPAHAYLDGGMGGMLVQLLLGGAAGLFAFCKLYWHKWFGKKPRDK
jgi:hypothetical protein